MNVHYIELMIKEQRRQELEECKRICLLQAAGYSDAHLLKRILLALRKTLHFSAGQIKHITWLRKLHFATRR